MTNAEARFNESLRPRKPEGSLGRTAQDGHLDSHTAPELYVCERATALLFIYFRFSGRSASFSVLLLLLLSSSMVLFASGSQSGGLPDQGKLLALVYDITPPTTALVDYAIGFEKLSVYEQFFVGIQTAVSL